MLGAKTTVPPELRVKIFRSLFIIGTIEIPDNRLTKHENACMRSGYQAYRVQGGQFPRNCHAINASAQLLSTCKQLCMEGCPILYGENAFKFTMAANLKYFIFKLAGKPKMSLLRYIELTKFEATPPSKCWERMTELKLLAIPYYYKKPFFVDEPLDADNIDPFYGQRAKVLELLGQDKFIVAILASSKATKLEVTMQYRPLPVPGGATPLDQHKDRKLNQLAILRARVSYTVVRDEAGAMVDLELDRRMELLTDA